ncbi:hypothetical protein [Shinella sp. HZN7]|uniref:hypothetical protein n=1 Tax=Shinella sp. (strain HZN7) TaxID=879274 RepID=UPI0007DA7AC8|nr:hypothetical protein [Shinella sp. HZN7]ANH04556.1 hypothetical protein shn_11255 [Shinella sp. HZN7]
MDEETRRNWEIITMPPGTEWSGRARYAAAMYFCQRGEMASDVLEVYRICSRLDAEDPVSVLKRWQIGAEWIARLKAYRSE